MRTILAVGYVFFFVISALAGYGLSQQTLSPISPATQSDTDFPLPNTFESKQINLLLVNVRQLDDKRPGLQVIWLVALNPNTSIKLIPIYPTDSQDQRSNLSLSKIFGLKKTGAHFTLNKTSLDFLQKLGLEWDGTIILDNRALAYFIDTFGAIRVGENTVDRDTLASFKFPIFEDSQLSLTYHTLFWREICWNILHSPENIVELNSDFRKHISATFTEKYSEQDWVELLSKVRIPSCEFPMYFKTKP
jgi:hypothetical protein